MALKRQPTPTGDLLFRGNSHVGPLIHTFSLPAFSTCPGCTLACLACCYALGHVFERRDVLARHKANWERVLESYDRFARDLIQAIRHKGVFYLRVHVSGDLFDRPYVLAWLKVARACKKVRFLFYTRSWRVAGLRDPLAELAALPNVYAFWSEDRNTGPCDLPHGRRCFLCTDAADEALVPPGVLVFREDHRVPRKWVNGSWVCPKEQRKQPPDEPGRPRITCSSCGWCLTERTLPVPPAARGRRGAGD